MAATTSKLTISVIIAAKNAEDTIGPAIRSALFGLTAEDEVLVMLDNPSDETAARVQSIHDERLRVFSSPVTLGRSEARNKLIKKSRGEIIAILDADDLCLPWRFKRGRKALHLYDAVFSTALIFGPRLRAVPLLPQLPRPIGSAEFALELLGRNPIVHSSAMYRRRAIPCDLAYRKSEAEEYDLWLRMANEGARMKRFGFPWVMYRLHESQASRTEGFVERGESCRLVREEQTKLARTLGIPVSSLEEMKHQARVAVSKKSLLARVEVLGLPRFLRKIVGTN